MIATKGGRHITQERDNQKDFSAAFLRSELHESLERLRLESVFLFQLHNPSLTEIADGEIFAEPERLRKQGLIRWYGVSVDTPEEGLAVLKTKSTHSLEGLISLQVIYSPINHGGIRPLLQRAEQSSVAIVAREVLVRGFLTNAFPKGGLFQNPPSAIKKLYRLYGEEQLTERIRELHSLADSFGIPIHHLAVRYALQNPLVTTTLVGINHPDYFEEIWGALNEPLPEELVTKLDQMPQLRTIKTR